jgi:cyclopropane fatty-acyl-phospholipid synthase-like methyltransferase
MIGPILQRGICKFMKLNNRGNWKMSEKPLSRKSYKDLKELYKTDYVERFSKSQSFYRLERLLKYIQLLPDFHVADFACGNGMLLPYLAPNVAQYIGIDFSEEFINDANEKKKQLGIKNAEFYCDDINSFCENHPTSYDCAFAMDFSEHVYDDEWIRILRSIKKSLKPGGALYLHTPNSLFFLEQMKKHSFILKQFDEHVAVRTPEENVNLLKCAGYKINRVFLLPHYNILRLIHFITYIPFIGKYFNARIFIQASA